MIKRPSLQPAEGHSNSERWLLTYADMITLLTAFFLMLYSMSVMSKGKFSQLATSVRSGFGGVTQGGNGILANSPGGAIKASNSQGGPTLYQSAIENLHSYVEQHELRGQVTAHEDSRGIVISVLADNMLFARGKADILSASVPILTRVGEILKTVPNKVEIEGHTCNLPIHTALFPSNWELSTARSGAILRFFTDGMSLPGDRFQASGYADTKPVVPNTSEANRAKNRRVDIVLLKTDAEREADLTRKSEERRILVSGAGQLPSVTTPDTGPDTNVAKPDAPSASPTIQIPPAGPSVDTGASPH